MKGKRMPVGESRPPGDEVAAPNVPNASGESGRVAWEELLGHEVRVLKDGCVIRTGFVDAVTVGADGLWIAAEGVEARAFFEKARGHVVLPTTQPPVPIVHYIASFV
jgi:hypothetical protein